MIWIIITSARSRSRLAWARELKFQQNKNYQPYGWVAPCVGAWVEISQFIVDAHGYIRSRLAWARELKFGTNNQTTSNPCRALRGRVSWNLYERELVPSTKVAPCVGAWVEMRINFLLSPLHDVAPCVGAWVEILHFFNIKTSNCVAPCVGAWVEIKSVYLTAWENTVAPCVGAWVEITQPKIENITTPSRLAWARELKYYIFLT